MDVLQFISLLLSPLLGAIAAGLLLKKQRKSFMKWGISFSGAFLLGVVFMEMIPELFRHNEPSIGIWMVLGFLFQLLLDSFTKGIEHGHVHTHDFSKNQLWPIFIGLSIHAFLEGLPIDHYSHHYHGHDHSSFLPFLNGLLVHKFMAGFTLFLFMAAAIKNKMLNLALIVGFAIMSPLGFLIGSNLNLSVEIFNILLSFVLGSLLHIATIIIFEQDPSDHHKFSLKKLIPILLGLLAAGLILV